MLVKWLNHSRPNIINFCKRYWHYGCLVFIKSYANKKNSGKKGLKKSSAKEGSKKVTKHSNAMDLEKDVFNQTDPKKIAESVKRSAEKKKKKSRTLSICYVND
jgi:hypothetical protein